MRVRIALLAASMIITLTSHAQDNYTPAGHEGWLVSLEKAYALSEKTGKPIMANFTGSDWCGWCKRLSAEVFNKQAFQDWANENVVLLELDYPQRKKLSDEQRAQNHELQQAFQVTGFPTIWIFDLERDQTTRQFQIKAIGKMGYVPGGSQAFTGQADQMIAQAKARQ